jgi:hypothetical protein
MNELGKWWAHFVDDCAAQATAPKRAAYCVGGIHLVPLNRTPSFELFVVKRVVVGLFVNICNKSNFALITVCTFTGP